jgi:hypothetical protein
MKSRIAAALFSAALIIHPAFAGGMAEPVMEPAVIEEETTAGSNAGILVPIFALVMFGLAVSSGDDAPPAWAPRRTGCHSTISAMSASAPSTRA